jgi:hypothetical protein
MAGSDMTRRTKVEIAQAFVDFLKRQEKPFYQQTIIDELKMNSQTVDEWLQLYEIFNKGPVIEKLDLPSHKAYKAVERKKARHF